MSRRRKGTRCQRMPKGCCFDGIDDDGFCTSIVFHQSPSFLDVKSHLIRAAQDNGWWSPIRMCTNKKFYTSDTPPTYFNGYDKNNLQPDVFVVAQNGWLALWRVQTGLIPNIMCIIVFAWTEYRRMGFCVFIPSHTERRSLTVCIQAYSHSHIRLGSWWWW